MKVELEKVLHMVGGLGETSYAANSRIQEHAISIAKPIVVESLSEVYTTLLHPESLSIVDLGCSSGPTAFMIISDVMSAISSLCQYHNHQQSPELLFFLNDLPGNDFNTIFKSLALFEKKLRGDDKTLPFYVVGAPGSFYGRLFPKESIHFMHSSYSLHWLSQVPKGLDNYGGGRPTNPCNIYIAKTSSSSVYKAYLEQFHQDFSTFLKMRAQELVSGGQMVLTLLGRDNPDPLRGEMSVLLELLTDALTSIVSEGLLVQEKVDEFDMPFYSPSTEEVRAVILSEGSFDLKTLQQFKLNWDPYDPYTSEDYVLDNKSSGENASRCVRSALEPMMASQFGEEIVDTLFKRFAENVAKHLVNEKTRLVNFTMVLKKKLLK